MADSPASLADEVRRVLHDAVTQLRELHVDRSLAGSLQRFLESEHPLSTLHHDLDAAGRLMVRTAVRVDEIERAEASRHPLEPTWFEVNRRDLEHVAAPDRASTLASMWLSALDGERFDLCDRIAELAPTALVPDETRTSMSTASGALAARDPADALPALAELAPAFPGVTAQLTAMLALIHLRTTGDTTAALHAATTAVDQARNDSGTGTTAFALAVLAEVQLERGDREQAGKTIAEALAMPVHEPDVHLVAGLLEQQRANWQQMDDHYDEAARRFVERGTQVGLIRAAPANLQWRMARHLAASDAERAHEYVVAGVRAGVLGRGEYPDRKALADKARIEEQLGRLTEAATTYGAAADRYAWSGAFSRARNLYHKARELAPDDVELAWRFAEALRGQVEDDDTIVDRAAAEEARRILRDAVACRRPGPSHAWVLATDAGLGMVLGDPSDEVTLLAERALMLDGSDELLHALLISVLRLGGHVREAVEAAEVALGVGGRDPLVVAVASAARADAGDLTRALQIIAEHPEPDPSLAVRAAGLHLFLDDADAALKLLEAAPSSDLTRLTRGLALEAQGHPDQAAVEFEAVWAAVSTPDGEALPGARRTAATAARYTGRFETAAGILHDLARRGPLDTDFRLDLGLTLILNGDPAGGGQILEAIEKCTVVEELDFLDRIEIQMARTRVEGTLHEQDAVAALDAAAACCTARIASLRAAIRPGNSLVRRAAKARQALARGRFVEAVERHMKLLDKAPEARHALARAVAELTAEGDRLQQEGHSEEAQRLWTVAVGAATATDDAVVTRLQARIAVSQLDDHGNRPAPHVVSGVLAGAEPVAALRAALELCVHDVPSAWRLRDRLLDLRNGMEQGSRLLVDAADAVPFGAAYRLNRDAVPATATFPMFTPVEVRLPARSRALVGSPALGAAIATLRGQLAVDTGIRIPGVRVVTATGSHADELTITVYGMVVHEEVVPDDRSFDADHVATVLGSVLRSHMHRMIGSDDVGLWLGGWDDPTGTQWHAQPGLARPGLDCADRLRLSRLLRRLLREGVPVVDRVSIMAGFTSARERGEGTAGILRAVRKRLPADQLCSGAGRPRHALPERLAERIRPEVNGIVWRSARTAAAALMADLRSWRGSLPEDAVVTVEDDVLRPIVWKLLLAVGLPTPVLSSEEDTP